MAAFNFHRRRTRRWWYAGATLTAAAFFTVFFVVGAGATLSGSNFESADGNLAVDTAGNHDWANAPNRTAAADLVKSTSDDAFGGGSKEDNSSVNVVQGSIPPNKSDLSEFYTSHESVVGGDTYLYLAWERSNILGSANIDFELNQAETTFPSSGAVTINRTPGDLLFTYDFTNGGSHPVLGMLTWLTSDNGSASDCFSSNALPCWGDRVDLSAAGLADGAINTGTVHDPILDKDLPGLTFGEMAVDLTLALPDAFGPNPTTCESFGQAFAKSRSSNSFPAELKDFIAPVGISISNCGHLLVYKTAGDTGDGQAGATFSVSPGQTINGTTDTSDDMTDLGDGYYCLDNLLLSGTYTVTETAAPDGYDIPDPDHVDNLSASAGGCPTDPTSETPATTFEDPPSTGAILITKTAKNADAGSDQPLAGAKFTVDGVQKTTDANGEACWDGLPFDTYTVHEDSAPSGYATADDQDVTVSQSATCGSGDEATASFSDAPLTDIAVSATAQDPGATHSTIDCVDADSNSVGSSGSTPVDPASASADDLVPGTYTCTIVIDP